MGAVFGELLSMGLEVEVMGNEGPIQGWHPV